MIKYALRTKMRYGYFLGCEYTSVFLFLFEKNENASV